MMDDGLRKALQLTGSDQTWALIRALRRFEIKELVSCSNVHRDTIRDYLKDLVAGGYLAMEGTTCHLVKDIGVDRPRLKKDGSEVPQTGREKAWRAMKMLNIFSVKDLNLTCGIAVTDARDYVSGLHHVGILVLVAKARPGVGAKYSLPPRANTGPRPPSMRRDRSVFDPNTRTNHYPRESRS
ncbi:MAG: hypothetical protein HQL95_04535 [Magnetococcales bacterium]|nr:hypothetical protein [Magnetococcales bacterium]